MSHNLELVSDKELTDELLNRFEYAVFIGCKPGSHTPDMDCAGETSDVSRLLSEIWFRYHGDMFLRSESEETDGP